MADVSGAPAAPHTMGAALGIRNRQEVQVRGGQETALRSRIYVNWSFYKGNPARYHEGIERVRMNLLGLWVRRRTPRFHARRWGSTGSLVAPPSVFVWKGTDPLWELLRSMWAAGGAR